MKPLNRPFNLFLILALFLSFGLANTNTSGQNVNKILKFKKFACIDTQGTGLEAYSFLMPSEWKFEGGISWNPEQVAMPASNAFRVFSPA